MKSLYGLVPVGGRSRRMGRPKETFFYHDEPESHRVFRMLENLTEKTFYSIRPDQAGNSLFETKPKIIDRIEGYGPLGALWTAFLAHPGVSWLFVPIDMPFLNLIDLERLVAAREKNHGIVAYRGGKTGFHPLPAIYETELSDAAIQVVDLGKKAILELGKYTNIRILPVFDPRPLTNVNTIHERERVMEILHD